MDKLLYKVERISYDEAKPWILKKHYAHRLPSISFAFGLFRDKELVGVCAFGTPAKLMNDGRCIFKNEIEIKTYELNRLIIKENHEPNLLSFFVSQCLKLIIEPCVIVSYSDIGQGHHGYIYQATNWIYTGITEKTGGYSYYFDNDWQHPRTTVAKFGTRKHSEIINKFPEVEFKRVSQKHRYFQFLVNKREKRKLMNNLKYPILPYPKGNNKRYDASAKVEIQGRLI